MLPGLKANGTEYVDDSSHRPGAGIAATPQQRVRVGCNLTKPMRWKQIVAMLGERVDSHGVVVDIHVSRAGSVLADGPKPPGELPVGHPVHLIFQEAS